jgi:hypothetical protein
MSDVRVYQSFTIRYLFQFTNKFSKTSHRLITVRQSLPLDATRHFVLGRDILILFSARAELANSLAMSTIFVLPS